MTTPQCQLAGVILSGTPDSYSFSLISIRYLRRLCCVSRGSRVSEAGIAWRVSPQDVDGIGVVQPPQARPQSADQAVGRGLSGVETIAAWAVSLAAGLGGSSARVRRRSRRNVVAALGVKLIEAPEAPSRGEVRIGIPSGQRLSRQQLVALGDNHPSGDTSSLHAATSGPEWITHAVIGRMARCMTTGPAHQVGGDSGSRVAEKSGQSCPGNLASWKDPL